MEKIIQKLIKEFSDRNKRADYVLDFKNNIICYKNMALYHCDLRMFNYDYMVSKDIKMNDFSDIINEKEFVYDIEYDCIRKLDGINIISYTFNNMIISVGEKLVKLVDSFKYVRGNNPYSTVKYFDDDNNIIAYILPVKCKGRFYDR